MSDDDHPSLDPRRVHALIVGIESYDISPRWDLPGPARDALRVAQWLTEQAKVPTENVHLLLSPLDRTGAGRSDAVLPTRENVERVLFKELPAQEGDLLWCYWAGHGYLDEAHQLLLPYCDATAELTTHLNLEAALRWWKAHRPGRTWFPRQIAIGDACRVPAIAAKGLTFGRAEYGGARPDPLRRQFTLYAARAGEMAQNLSDRGAGQFTDSLLRVLDGYTLSDAVSGLADVAQAVQADLKRLRSQNQAWQHPQFLIDRDWSESSIFGDRWLSGVRESGTVVASRLDHLAWQQLGPLLEDRPAPPHAYDAYRWAFETADCVLPTQQLPCGGLAGIAEDLDSRQGPERPLPLVIPFVCYLAARTDDAGWSRAAKKWAADTCVRLQTATVPLPPAAAEESPSFHIQLGKDARGGTLYWAQMWTYSEGSFRTVWQSVDTVGLAVVQKQLAQHLVAPGRSVRRIEFHAPYELLLDEEFEAWQLPIGRGGKLRVLGQEYEVVVRCPDERDGVAGEHWRRKWEWLKVHGGLHPEAVRLLTDSQVSPALGLRLQVDAAPVCILAEVSQGNVPQTLGAALDAGVPIAVWPRRYEAGDSHGARWFDSGSGRIDLHQLPDAIRRNRLLCLSDELGAGLDAARPVALMWDDPERVPERRPLA